MIGLVGKPGKRLIVLCFLGNNLFLCYLHLCHLHLCHLHFCHLGRNRRKLFLLLFMKIFSKGCPISFSKNSFRNSGFPENYFQKKNNKLYSQI